MRGNRIVQRPRNLLGLLVLIAVALICLTPLVFLLGCAADSQSAQQAADVRASMAETSSLMDTKRAELEARVREAATPEETAKRLHELAEFDKARDAFKKADVVVQTMLNADGTVNAAGVITAATVAIPQPYGVLAGLGVSLAYGVIARQRERAREKKAAELAEQAKADAGKAIAGTPGGAWS